MGPAVILNNAYYAGLPIVVKYSSYFLATGPVSEIIIQQRLK